MGEWERFIVIYLQPIIGPSILVRNPPKVDVQNITRRKRASRIQRGQGQVWFIRY